MMVLENQDYDSISEIIGISPTNVRVKIHRIKKRLETILKKLRYTAIVFSLYLFNSKMILYFSRYNITAKR